MVLVSLGLTTIRGVFSDLVDSRLWGILGDATVVSGARLALGNLVVCGIWVVLGDLVVCGLRVILGNLTATRLLVV